MINTNNNQNYNGVFTFNSTCKLLDGVTLPQEYMVGAVLYPRSESDSWYVSESLFTKNKVTWTIKSTTEDIELKATFYQIGTLGDYYIADVYQGKELCGNITAKIELYYLLSTLNKKLTLDTDALVFTNSIVYNRGYQNNTEYNLKYNLSTVTSLTWDTVSINSIFKEDAQGNISIDTSTESTEDRKPIKTIYINGKSVSGTTADGAFITFDYSDGKGNGLRMFPIEDKITIGRLADE